MITIKNISKDYGSAKVVDKVNIKIDKGQIFGFLGPNGAGKTTLMKMIVGITNPDKGEILINIKNIKEPKNREIIGYMPEDPYFYEHLTALELLIFLKDLFKNKTQEKPETILGLVGLGKAKNKKIGEFSKGMKQRLGLAQAIINDPEYLFLDEPLDGLDPIGRKEFKEIILSLKKRGKTVFFNSHILADVEEICDQIGVINNGKLIYEGNVKKFCGKKTLENAFVSIIQKEKGKR